jgi:hypothetical protein
MICMYANSHPLLSSPRSIGYLQSIETLDFQDESYQFRLASPPEDPVLFGGRGSLFEVSYSQSSKESALVQGMMSKATSKSCLIKCTWP